MITVVVEFDKFEPIHEPDREQQKLLERPSPSNHPFQM
jgi:hypothetical protein